MSEYIFDCSYDNCYRRNNDQCKSDHSKYKCHKAPPFSSLKDAKILRQIKKRLRLSANAREGLFFEFSLSVLQRFPYLSLKDTKILRHKKSTRMTIVVILSWANCQDFSSATIPISSHFWVFKLHIPFTLFIKGCINFTI